MQIVKRQAATMAAQRALSVSNAQVALSSSSSTEHPRRLEADHMMNDVSADGGTDGVKVEDSGGQLQASPQNGVRQNDGQRVLVVDPRIGENQLPAHLRQSWEYIEEVVQILKTAFPLLILSLETMVDQIAQRFKATPEEEIYRLVCMLLQDAINVSVHSPNAICLILTHASSNILFACTPMMMVNSPSIQLLTSLAWQRILLGLLA